MIGENYDKKVSDAKLRLWWDLLKEYEYADIHQAAYSQMQNSSFMLTPADLIKLMEPDYDEIFDRCMRRVGYKNDIERITWNAVGYACRTQLSEKDARVKFKKEYERQVKLSKQPVAPTTHRIEQSQPVNIKDKMVDEGIEKYKNKTPEEIKQMIAKFKIGTRVKK